METMDHRTQPDVLLAAQLSVRYDAKPLCCATWNSKSARAKCSAW